MLMVNQLIGFGAASAGINPDDIANLYSWHRADLGLNLSTPIWSDQSVNSYDLDTKNGTPSTTTTTNGQAAVDFKDTSDIRDATALSQALPIHWFIVCRWDTYGTADRPLLLDEAGGTSHPGFRGNGSGEVDVFLDGASRVTSSGAPSTGTWGLLHAVCTSSIAKVAWNNGGYQSSGALTISNGVGGICLGGIGNGVEFGDVAIAENIIYTAEITGSDLTGLLDYFNNRYALW